MNAVNKWNGKKYKVIEMKDSTILLEREDGTELEISRKEFLFSYRTDKEGK